MALIHSSTRYARVKGLGRHSENRDYPMSRKATQRCRSQTPQRKR